uniref:Ammonium transporter AmtB-like domain-containing protein n=1 Tax=Hemiselmis andersenii TaxID=464988 RepID=A0A7S1E1L8_HEMAN|mmetsp:Transcript_33583/g.81866  ORF Transcript_33583/g.81866 Transcript_33583/m.81866 type:complete len:727 (+) Transcript_33583:163-2343(+)
MDSGNGIPEIPPQCVNTREISDEAWMLSQCFKIMMMQAGFAVVESSFVRQKNSANIMMKNTVDLALGAMLYWAFGYALAYGVDPSNPENVNPFCGTGQFFLIDGHDAANWMFQLSFAATAATIDSGAVAERMQFVPYLLYSGFMTSLFYPIVCHWCWDSEGWLSKMGFHDFAGSGPVHLMGGASSLVAAWFIGPRIGRFADKGELEVTVVRANGLEPKNPDAKPYVIVRQLNHGRAERETRTSEDPNNPMWGTKVNFEVSLDGDAAEPGGGSKGGAQQDILEGDVVCYWTTADDWNAKDRAFRSKHGDGASKASEREGEASSGILGSFERIMSKGKGSTSARRSMDNNSNSSRIAPAPSVAPPLLSGGSVTGMMRIATVKKDHLDLKTSVSSKSEKVAYDSIDKIEDWGEKNMLVHLRDLRVLEIGLATAKERDTWLFKLLHAWRPTVSAQRIAIVVVDEATDNMIGEGKMTVYAVDKPDPEKFKMKTFVALSGGGKVEVDAAYTSPQRMTREIFQACDPNKLLFGTFLLWINWYSFNSGSTTAITGGGVKLASSVAITTTLAACAGGVFSMAWSWAWTGAMMVEPMATGILGGLVSICASCDVVSQWESLIIGTVGAFISINCVDLVNWMKIDDPCAAAAIHGASGFWGVIAVGLFARPEMCVGTDITGLFHGGGGTSSGCKWRRPSSSRPGARCAVSSSSRCSSFSASSGCFIACGCGPRGPRR